MRGQIISIEAEFHEEMLALYWKAGRAMGYWANRYLQSVRNNGGRATAQRLLSPAKDLSTGLVAAIKGGRPDITVESLALNFRYADLFTPAEFADARCRLDAVKND